MIFATIGRLARKATPGLLMLAMTALVVGYATVGLTA